MSVEKEFEVAYTFTFPQDMLYTIKTFLDKHFTVATEYVEILDVNNVRTRIGDGQSVSVKKSVIDVSRFVVPLVNGFVPMIKRECDETIYEKCSDKIKRLCKTRVYNIPELLGNVEIKFEHIYFEENDGDTLDPLTAHKQILLHNHLRPDRPIDLTSNSHLGSDEILANCRVEIEYDSEPDANLVLLTAKLIKYIEFELLPPIAPFISHTNIFNEIMYRPFAAERLVTDNLSDVVLWALKLDGTRGKGYIVNGSIFYVQLDDMQMFSYKIQNVPNKSNQNNQECPCNLNCNAESGSRKVFETIFEAGSSSTYFCCNRILGVQVEYIEATKTFYITDVLNLYKYNYDNRNQFDISTPYNVDVYDSINFINNRSNCLYLYGEYYIKFQHFKKERDAVSPLDKSDGYIGVLKCGDLIKVKYQKSFEMKYVGGGVFKSTMGHFLCDDFRLLTQDNIYEVLIDVNENKVKVIKERLDRVLYN